MSNYVYKIFDPKTGLYSDGGIWSIWTKRGKMFLRLCDVKAHLTYISRYGHHDKLGRYKRCQLITYRMTEIVVPGQPTLQEMMGE